MYKVLIRFNIYDEGHPCYTVHSRVNVPTIHAVPSLCSFTEIRLNHSNLIKKHLRSLDSFKLFASYCMC